MADEEGSILGLRPDSLAYAILGELATLLDGLAADRRDAGEKIKALEASRRNNPQDFELRRIAIRQEAAIKGLERVIRFIHSPAVFSWQSDVLERGLIHHLKDLFNALEDLGAGSPPDLFELPSGRKKVGAPSQQRLWGKVAAIAQLLIAAGDDVDPACDLVAEAVGKIGHKKAYGRKEVRSPDERTIRGNTVKAWRRKAMEGSANDPLVQSYNDFLALADMYRVETGEIAHDLRGGKDLVTPVKSGAGRKSTNSR